VAIIGGLAVSMRHRQPKSVDANMAEFRRGLEALAPDSDASSHAAARPEDFKIRPVPPGALSKKRLGPDYMVGAEVLDEVAGDPTGGHLG